MLRPQPFAALQLLVTLARRSLYLLLTALTTMAAPAATVPSVSRLHIASPTSILHFIRSTPSPHPPAAYHTCHVTLAPLPAYSLYAHGLTSVSPPAVLMHHMLPSPPPLLAHVSMASQHLQSAYSAHHQPIDAPYVFTAVGMPPHTATHAQPAHSYTPTPAATPLHTQPCAYSAYPHPMAASALQYQSRAAVCSSPPTHPQLAFHSSAPLRAVEREPFRRYRRRLTDEEEQLAYFKTEVCRAHLTTGHCQFGADCQYAHSFDELRPREYDSKYKTELCKRYHTLGAAGCKFGVRCKFLHDEVRVKASDGEYWLCSEAEAIVRVEVVPTHHYHRRQLLDQLTFYPPTGPVSPLSTSPIPPRRPRRTLSPPPFAAQVPSLASLPAFLAAAVSPAHSTRSVPLSGIDSGESTSTSSSGGGSGSGVGGTSYSMPARYRRVGEGEFVLDG